ncbi:MAG: HDIG domain-containing metalloprotein [Thermoguttaceae bacterium]
MATGTQRKTRLERVAALELPPGRWERAWASLQRRDVLLRIGLCVATAALLCWVIRGWDPPLVYRAGQVLPRDVVARVEFEAPDPASIDLGADPAEVLKRYQPGQRLVEAGRALSASQVQLLRAEYEAFVAQRPLVEKLGRGLAVFVLILALFGLCALYLFHRERRLLVNLRQLALILGLIVMTVMAARWAAADLVRAEIVPFLLFGQVMAIAYRQELALLLAVVVALVMSLAIRPGLSTFLLLMAVALAAILQLGRIRSRSKLIYVSLSAGLVALLSTIALAVLENQPIGPPFWVVAGSNALWTVAAGFLLTGVLPAVEKLFGAFTDMSLLELGDMSHPLLQQLVQRAPSTYNHSITVGLIAEAAAEAIGAHGLLVRVGAYYHDIGKMLNPEYFAENQPPDENRHESLLPTMSALVIVAHIKDGANLARQHRLPTAITDLIHQHHGTTRVEYFYDRAYQQSQHDPNGGQIDESLYRYPGPKPQTKEAGVLMLADAVESASRTLVDPAPARIENLVREVAEKKLDDGQFDESGLTLRELRTIEKSMAKSLIAIYHGRVKYPEPKPA